MTDLYLYLVKLFYTLPVLRIDCECNKLSFKFHARIVERDSRSFEWYTERREYGFDERELWGLSRYAFEKFQMLVKDVVDLKYESLHTVDTNLFRAIRLLHKREPDFVTFAKWLHDRVKIYNYWECPLSVYEKIGKSYRQHSHDEVLELSKTFENSLLKYINGEPLTKEEKFISLKMFRHYGW